MLVSKKTFFHLALFGSCTFSAIAGNVFDVPHLPIEKPAFSEITDVAEKKALFFEYIYPAVVETNQAILAERDFLETLTELTFADLSATQQVSFSELCEAYSISCSADDFSNSVAQLLAQVDIVPPSLALAQAASESGWGTSRFAVEGNNYFGQRCFDEGCGLVPQQRDVQKQHEVKIFASLQASVESYVRNLNTHAAYASLRELRAELRAQNNVWSGAKLASELVAYSTRGQAYVYEIQTIMHSNALAEYDAQLQETLESAV